jgi:acetolactate synthase-1/2/3 large subunit
VRIGDVAGELRDNRRGDVEILATSARRSTRSSRPRAIARRRRPGWTRGLRERTSSARASCASRCARRPSGRAGRIHPNRLLAALQDRIGTRCVASPTAAIS